MNQLLTIVCKLQPSLEQAAKLEATLKAFGDACNFVNQNSDSKITNNVVLQSLLYYPIRQEFGLPANLAVRVFARVASNRKTARQKKRPVSNFAHSSADYDARLFDLREKNWQASLSTVEGRERISMAVGNYQKGKLSGKKPTSAQLCKHKDGQFYIHIQVKDEPPALKKTANVIGVDFGRTAIAVTSEGDKWDGKTIRDVRDQFSTVRASLQRKASKGTRSGRRRCRQILQRLSGRERRFQSWLNHGISKTIINTALTSNALVAIEDLTGIRERTNTQPRPKTERRRSNSWAFYQLRNFLEYKGIKAGVEVLKVNPAYTSVTCHKCLGIHPTRGKSYRSGKRFDCGNCGWSGDADFNGANLIKLLGLTVNQPTGPILYCNLRARASFAFGNLL
jgi:putative transposase